MQNPNYPSKQAEQEKPIKRREGLKPNPRHQGSRRTNTRRPENPNAAGPEEEHGTWEKTKWHSKEPSNPTPEVDQQTGVRHANAPVKGEEPRRGSSGRGSCAGTREKPKGGNRTSVLRHPQPNAKPPLQE